MCAIVKWHLTGILPMERSLCTIMCELAITYVDQGNYNVKQSIKHYTNVPIITIIQISSKSHTLSTAKAISPSLLTLVAQHQSQWTLTPGPCRSLLLLCKYQHTQAWPPWLPACSLSLHWWSIIQEIKAFAEDSTFVFVDSMNCIYLLGIW